MRPAICLLLLLSIAVPFYTIVSRAQRRPSGAASAAKALHALFDEEWDYEMRERARRELGAEFDVREYHDVALRSGAVPLDVLERQVNYWIAERKRKRVQHASTR